MNVTEVLEALRKAQQNPTEDPLNKAWTTATGLVNYDLERPAIALYPWGETMTPLRNATPRVKSNEGDTATKWKAITAIDTTVMPPGLSEGNRSGLISTTIANVTAAYVGLGLEDSVSFEADYASQGFDDARARAVEGLLRATMMAEENIILGGNSSVALGTTPTPVLVANATGGTIGASITVSVICVALTHDGWRRATVTTAGVIQQVARTNADASTDTINAGAAQKSAAATVAVSAGSVNSVSATVTAVLGAVAYAWYAGTAGAERIFAITTINSCLITSLPGAGQLASALTANDRSAAAAYVFDGYLYQTGFKSGSGAYYAALATGVAGTGTALTADGFGGVAEINTALRAFWDNSRLGPDTLWCSAQEALNINKKIVQGGAAPLFRFNMDASSPNMNLVGGVIVGSILNPFTQQQMRIRIHPNMPPGTILFTSSAIPYPLSGVGSVARIKARREYYQIEWPLRTRKYEFGVYVDEVLQVYALFSFGVLTNIANG